jgi:cysteinyl-tRNA synthetase
VVLRIYNTRTHSIEDFKPARGNRVYMFVCGPTVYDHSHIGHARTYLAYDIIARYLRAKGYSLFYLMNITDIEDKIIKRANESDEDPLQLADRFTKEFMRDMESLGITSVNLYAKASEYVPEIISQIATLVEKGFAYQIGGDVYYDVSKFPRYGELSGQKIDQLVMHRIDPDERKRNVVDFALWKGQKPGEPSWDSPWGRGRPGWHIEDTAITTTYFGPSYDLHGGGLDLVFPHHEAEIAQAEAATGVEPLVRFWMHGGLLTMRGERMGHSMGNFITIEETLRSHDPEALRLYYGMRHYRSQLEYDESDIDQAEQVLDKLRAVYNQFKVLAETKPGTDINSEIQRLSAEATQGFVGAMDDDFNTPRALAAVITYSKEIEPYASREIGRATAELVVRTFDYFGSVFGILRPTSRFQERPFEGLLQLLLDVREEARKRGDWKVADNIRDSLTRIGIALEDTAAGSRWYFASARPNVKSS